MEPAEPPFELANVRLDLAYEGTNFRGFTESEGVRTVAGELRAALEELLGLGAGGGLAGGGVSGGEDGGVGGGGGELVAGLGGEVVGGLKLSVAGRTDAGVHASAQVVSFKVNPARLTQFARELGGEVSSGGGVNSDVGVGSELGGPGVSGAGGSGLVGGLNERLGPEIVVSSAALVPADFDARRSARSRSYTYLIRNELTGTRLAPALAKPTKSPRPIPPIQPAATAFTSTLTHTTAVLNVTPKNQWRVSGPLDLDAMNAAAAHLIGEHDFSSFCRQTSPPISLRRNVLAAHWSEVPADTHPTHDDSAHPSSPTSPNDPTEPTNPAARLLRFDISAWAFCHQMVRSIVGLCVAVGKGQRHCDEVPQIIAAKDRNASANLAPGIGLTLVAVRYADYPD